MTRQPVTITNGAVIDLRKKRPPRMSAGRFLIFDMAALTAYMAFTSRGKPFDIKIPNDPRALAAYQKGKEYFYTRRGQLNFSCASCHVQEPGERIRAEVLAPALGILNAMPIYRSEWGGMGTISRRFTTCNVQVRAVVPVTIEAWIWVALRLRICRVLTVPPAYVAFTVSPVAKPLPVMVKI